VSSIANLALPDPPPNTVLSHEEVLEMGARAVPALIALVTGVLERL
jgi:hypothetical protein